MARTGTIAAPAGALAAATLAARALRPRSGVIHAAPVAVDEHFNAAELRRARRYGRPQLVLSLAGMAVEGAVLAALARRQRRRRGAAPPGHPVAGAAVAGAGLSVALTLAPLPFSAVARKRALNAGLATQSWRGWGEDLAKSSAIGAVLAGGGAALAVWMMRRWGSRWWAPAAAGSVAVGAAFTFAGPVLLDPIFNSFTPLPEGRTRDDVLALARAAGVRVRGVYEVDASRRTTAANAYVNGLGATRRVVLFDTLLSTFTRDEARLVVAHELAHVRHRDVPRGICFLALVAPASMNAVAQIVRGLDPRPADPGAQTVPALALALGAVSFATTIVSNSLSREIERRADTFALQLTGTPEAFVSFERRIVLQNLADPAPPRWLSALLGTHPPTVERIGIARAFAAGAEATTRRRRRRPTRRRRRTPAGS
jgi:STE24 endopeptidase